MSYKKGDKVKVKSLDWYKANECSGRVMCDGIAFDEKMTEWWELLTCNHNYITTQWKYPGDWFKLGIVKTCTKCSKVKC